MLGYVRSVLDLAAKTSDSVVCVKYASLFKKIARHWGDQIVEFSWARRRTPRKGMHVVGSIATWSHGPPGLSPTVGTPIWLL
jgi:hypothetical protein